MGGGAFWNGPYFDPNLYVFSNKNTSENSWYPESPWKFIKIRFFLRSFSKYIQDCAEKREEKRGGFGDNEKRVKSQTWGAVRPKV